MSDDIPQNAPPGAVSRRGFLASAGIGAGAMLLGGPAHASALLSSSATAVDPREDAEIAAILRRIVRPRFRRASFP